MATEEGEVPEAPAEGEEDKQELTEEQVADVSHTAVKIDEIAHRISMKSSMYMRTGFSDEERVEVDRTDLEAILDVGSRLQDIQKKSKISMSTLALAHESYKDKQAKAKEARNNRTGGIKTQHRFLLENAGSILDRPTDYVLDGVYDSDIHMDLLDSAVVEGGRNCIVLCDALLPPLKMSKSLR